MYALPGMVPTACSLLCGLISLSVSVSASVSPSVALCLCVYLSLSDPRTHSFREDITSGCIGMWISLWKAADWIPNLAVMGCELLSQGLFPALRIQLRLSRTVSRALWAPGPSVLYSHGSLPFSPTISSTWNSLLPYLCLLKPYLWLSSNVLCVKLYFLSQAI